MKTKSLLMVLMILVVILFYNLFCYHFVNKMIDSETRYIVTNYFNNVCNNCEFSYEYKKAVLNNDGSLNVYVKYKDLSKEEYYGFVVIRSMGAYKIAQVNNEIPAYIK